jgi:hypothetical protein
MYTFFFTVIKLAADKGTFLTNMSVKSLVFKKLILQYQIKR